MFIANLFFCILVDAAALEDVSNYTFAVYKKEFGREYREGDGEHELRRGIFEQRIAEIQAHNALELSWKLGINDLTDRTGDELKQLNGHRPWMRAATSKTSQSSSMLETVGDVNGTACMAHEMQCTGGATPCCDGLVCGPGGLCEKVPQAPVSWDWSKVLPTADQVLNQGPCGSCWAVAAAAAVQLQAVINTKGRFQQQISPQNFLSCTPNEYECGGQGGCEGATAELAFQWLQDAATSGGVHTIGQQRYTAHVTKHTCPVGDFKSYSFLQKREMPSSDSVGPAIKITGWKKLEVNSAEDMVKHLVTVGPLVGSVVGSGLFQYSSGVIPGCTSTVMDHAILLMGYGEDESAKMKYWKVRNSWGPVWGEDGYFRLQKFYPDTVEPCATDYEPDKGVACKDKPGPEGKYPESQEVCGSCAILGDTVYPIGTSVPEELWDHRDEPQLIRRHEFA